MPKQPVELVRELIEVRSRGDADWLVGHADEDTEIHSVFAVGTEGEPYRGRDGARQWIADAVVAFSSFSLAAHDVRELPDGRVLALGQVSWRGRQSGVASEEPFGWICEFREGRLLRLLALPDWSQALEAAGLSE